MHTHINTVNMHTVWRVTWVTCRRFAGIRHVWLCHVLAGEGGVSGIHTTCGTLGAWLALSQFGFSSLQSEARRMVCISLVARRR